MEIGDRIKEVRNALHLNQSTFASKIGLKQAAVGLYENCQRKVSDRAITDICREYNVNENWLRSGEGEMFDDLSEDEETIALIAKLCSSGNEYKMMALRAAAKIIENDTCWGIIENELKKLIDNKKE